MIGRILSAAGKAGVRPELICAMRKTGRIVTASHQDLLTGDELQEWQDAIEEYLARKLVSSWECSYPWFMPRASPHQQSTERKCLRSAATDGPLASSCTLKSRWTGIMT
jgi:hypothetical protein